jgi:hypothetical protein
MLRAGLQIKCIERSRELNSSVAENAESYRKQISRENATVAVIFLEVQNFEED